MPRSLAPAWSYNVAVPAPSQTRTDGKPPRPHVYTLEASGLLIIAVLLLVLTIIRYWHHIPWSVR